MQDPIHSFRLNLPVRPRRAYYIYGPYCSRCNVYFPNVLSTKRSERPLNYSEDRVDATLEVEQWAERATLANAARLARFSISLATSTLTLSTL